MGFWWTLNLVLLQSLWGAFWMAAFWPCKGPQLSEAAEGRGGLETQDLLGACSFACRRSQTVYLHAAGWVRRQGVVELVGKWGDCFCRRQQLLGTYIYRVGMWALWGMWATYYGFFQGKTEIWVLHESSQCCEVIIKILVQAKQISLCGPQTASLQPLGGRLNWAMHCLGAVERAFGFGFAFGFNINPW